MPITPASRSVHISDELAQTHEVQFIVFTRLVSSRNEQLHQHLDAHLQFLKTLRDKGVLGIAGPFFTPEGTNSGNGLYVLRVDNLDEARRITEQDPLHKAGVRIPTVEVWLQVVP